MTETPAAADTTPAESTGTAPTARKRGGGLSSMLLADLKSMASGMGIKGAGSMKKAQLVDAIKAAQSGASTGARTDADAPQPSRGEARQDRDATTEAEAPAPKAAEPADRQDRDPQQAEGQQQAGGQQQERAEGEERSERRRRSRGERQREEQPGQPEQADGQQERSQQDRRQKGQDRGERQDPGQSRGQQDQSEQGQRQKRPAKGQQEQGDQNRQDKQRQDQNRQDQNRQDQNRQDQNRQDQNRQDQNRQDLDFDDDGEGGSRRNRRRRGRERTVTRTSGRNEPDTSILEDDVLVPAAGIIDVLDNYAFVRTSGYLPGTEDVYLSLSMVRKYGLRRGDAVVGQVRQPREGERREKFNPMVRIDSVNGADPESAKDRPDFIDATPVHPDQRLRLATDSDNVIGRVIDIAAPVGKGQRGLVLAPPRTGTTALLQSVATSVTTNNPECHVMVVLVDTRPEEVTDFQRAVKGEVIASTFDRQPADHTVVAELAIERAKRLVELGHDVVVLLDSLTRLGRAYNLAAPANGRVLGGGVDATAVHPTKQFFGAARNIEDGGSLTILATVPVETGSAVDELFLEEVAGAANLELRLSSARAAQGIVPAVDPEASGTRREELLLAPAEGAVVGDLRKKLAAARSQKDVLAVFSGGR